MKKTFAQHRRILEAIRGGNPDDAEAAIRGHLIASRENVVKYEQAGSMAKSPRRISPDIPARKLVSTAQKHR
jgi:DNA-binding GntR family transcriptional regulator